MLLIGFSGKKQSGKDTCAKFLARNSYELFGIEQYGVENFYFAAPIKAFAIEYLGIPHEMVWGTDEQKNKPTAIRWTDLPHWEKLCSKKVHEASFAEWFEDRKDRCLTARELLQEIGEGMFLGMDPRIWVRRWKGMVKEYQPNTRLGLVPDPRKPEQIDAIHELGGIVFRLTRDPYGGQDRHISETALDKDVYDWANFDEIIDNVNLTVDQTNRMVVERLRSRGLLKV
jgi:hypothetical protein